MRIQVHAPDLGPEGARRLGDRVRATLERYEAAIRQVVVRVRDENGPRGGEDQNCLVKVDLLGAPEVVVRQRGDRPLAALRAALKRARRSIGERINARGRRHSRAPRRTLADAG